MAARRISRRALLRAAPLGGLALLLDGPGALKRLRLTAGPAGPGAAAAAERIDPLADEGAKHESEHRREHDPLHKIRDFDRTYPDDYILAEERLALLRATAAKLERAVEVIGHGHFNLVSLDDLLRYALRYDDIGAFSRQELGLLDEIFYTDAEIYGFYGKKVIEEQTHRFDRREVELIGSTGHYLLKGEPLKRYRRIRTDLGDSVFLTSGVRSVVKQYQLFLSKAVATDGNLSQASRSLAPPGYSYHAVGDFDVGRVGFGLKNFTEEFAETEEYRKLIDLGYVDIRYTQTNPYGVRHEPWHIKIA